MSESGQPRRWALAVIGLTAVAAIIAGGGYWLKTDRLLPIRYVRVESAFRHLDPVDVRRVLAPVLVDAGYCSVALPQLRDAVESLPWVASARVQRVWPDTVVIRIDEQEPVVRWGDDSLLNRYGQRFTPSRVEGFEALPALSGRDGQEADLFRRFTAASRVLAESGLQLLELTVSDRDAWTIRIDGGLTIKMGRHQPWRALDRFLRGLPLLQKERHAMAVVDLRYPNGFAVRWKPGTELEWRLRAEQQASRPYRLAGLSLEH